jgi:hypothetical protein
LELVAREVDDVVVSYSSGMLESVASAYEDFAPVSDDDVLELLVRRTRRASVAARGDHDRVVVSPWAGDRLADRERLISVPVAGGVVRAHVGLPRRGAYETVRRLDRVRGLALLVHADGTDLNGIAGRYLAARLRLDGYATFRLSLTTLAEHQVGNHSRSALDVPMLASRMAEVCDWVAREGIVGGQRTILIGAGVAAPAALLAAGRRPQQVRGVIVCGGDADFVARSRSRPHAAVLVIAGADAAGLLAERAVEWLDRLDRWERNGASRRSP